MPQSDTISEVTVVTPRRVCTSSLNDRFRSSSWNAMMNTCGACSMRACITLVLSEWCYLIRERDACWTVFCNDTCHSLHIIHESLTWNASTQSKYEVNSSRSTRRAHLSACTGARPP